MTSLLYVSFKTNEINNGYCLDFLQSWSGIQTGNPAVLRLVGYDEMTGKNLHQKSHEGEDGWTAGSRTQSVLSLG